MKQSGDVEGLKELGAQPKLAEGDLFYFNAFYELDTERSHGMSLVRIPRSAVMDYAAECGLANQDAYDFLYVIRQLDDANLEALAAKRKHDTNA